MAAARNVPMLHNTPAAASEDGSYYSTVSTFKNIDNTVVSAYDVARNKGLKVLPVPRKRTSSLSKDFCASDNHSQRNNTVLNGDHKNHYSAKPVSTEDAKKYAHLRKPPISRRKIPQPVTLPRTGKSSNDGDSSIKQERSKTLQGSNVNTAVPRVPNIQVTEIKHVDHETVCDKQQKTATKQTSAINVKHEDTIILDQLEIPKLRDKKSHGNSPKSSDKTPICSSSKHVKLPSQDDININRSGHRRKLPRLPLQRTSSPKQPHSKDPALDIEPRKLSLSCSSIQDMDRMFDGAMSASPCDFSENSDNTTGSCVSSLGVSVINKPEDLISDTTDSSAMDLDSSKDLNISNGDITVLKNKTSQNMAAGSVRYDITSEVVDYENSYITNPSETAKELVSSENDRLNEKTEEDILAEFDTQCDEMMAESVCDINDQNADDLTNAEAESIDRSDKYLPENFFFSFDKDTIQGLTDIVMRKKESAKVNETESSKKNKNLSEHDSNSVEIVKDGTFSECMVKHDEVQSNIATGDRNKVLSAYEIHRHLEPCGDQLTINKTGIRSPEEKASIEGVSKCGKQADASHGNEKLEEKTASQTGQTQRVRAKVERTPSYKRRVMARAKSRYGKKSNKCKECSCVKNETGEILMCAFCENFEMKMQRSHTSLGNCASGGTNSEFESSENSNPRRTLTPGLPPLPSHDSPKSLRRVQVSPRVELLMSSNLFKKHLHKHEDLLNKHMMSYKRFGMKKSVSNLDLSDGYHIDSDPSQYDTESVNSEQGFDTENDSINSSLNMSGRQGTRRHSLTSETDPSLEQYQRIRSGKGFDTMPNSRNKSRPPIPTFQEYSGRAQYHYPIPSFHEFRKSRDGDGDQGTVKNNKNKTDKERTKSEKCFSEPMGQNLKTIVESKSKENLNEDIHVEPELNQRDSKSLKNFVELNMKVVNEKDSVFQIQNSRTDSPFSEMFKRQSSSPNLTQNKPNRIRKKIKSRTLSRLESESDSHYHSTGELSDTGSSAQSTPRRSGKRPRSVISKKSSLSSLIKEIPKVESEKQIPAESQVENRLKLKVDHTVTRSKSDTTCDSSKGRETESPKPKGQHSRHLSYIEKGDNETEVDLEDSVSQCSTQDVGESETSTSFANSTVSDSIPSEVVLDDTAKPVLDPDGPQESCKHQEDLDDPVEHFKHSGDPYEPEASFEHLEDQDDPEESFKHLRDPDDPEESFKNLENPDDTELDLSRNSKDDSMAPVLRSTSDACKITPEAARKRRERKERPYKSDPFSGTEIIPATKRCELREERARLKQQRHQHDSSSVSDEVLTFLDGVTQSDLAHGESFPSLEELNEDEEQPITNQDNVSERSCKLKKHLSNVSSLSTDSGVIGQDSQQSSPSNTLRHSQSEYHARAWGRTIEKGMRVFSASCSDISDGQITDCIDCSNNRDQRSSLHQQVLTICPQCYQRRIERKQTIQEIMDTEINYGRDLTILKEEFYIPMMKAGLLNKDQLDSIFLNIDELIHVNKHFITKLKSSIHLANQHNDDDLQEVMIGNMFLESSTMFLTFENYCVNQAQAPILLESLEREKELLRIFLSVSQNDNHLLRRMHLKSFLMVPVQRIMKYPLLLDRLFKATPPQNRDKGHIKEAKDKIEDILGHINAKSRTASIKHRKSSEKHCSVTEKIEVSRVALETLKWNRKDVCDVRTSRLHMTQPVDHTWALKRCKNYKFSLVHGVLLSLVQPMTDEDLNNRNNNVFTNNNGNNTNNNVRIQSAALVLIKEKNGKYQVMREPFMLENCVVSQDPEFVDVFEILEWNKEAFLFKAESPADTKGWVQSLRHQMHNLGCWRKRRNALPNILLNHLS